VPLQLPEPECLPLDSPSESRREEEPETRPEAQPRRLRVLMAEDNLINQRVGAAILRKQGHSVVLAGNGREALAALERERFDLVLMDVQMPEMDGFETAAAIRAREKGSGRRLPILALTAHVMKGDRERCLAAGMDGYVSKPIDFTQLAQVIEQVVEPDRP
jgi:CheY-like chemotaxis protein